MREGFGHWETGAHFSWVGWAPGKNPTHRINIQGECLVTKGLAQMSRNIRNAEDAARLMKACGVVHIHQHAAKACKVCKGI